MGTDAGATAGVLALPGARLAYQVTGDGPAVVLVHGFGLDMRMWDRQAEHLAARYQMITYDCRGFGSSGPFDPWFVLAHLPGRRNVRVYDGSWTEWGRMPYTSVDTA